MIETIFAAPTYMERKVGDALRFECRRIFGTDWSLDVAWRLARAAIGATTQEEAFPEIVKRLQANWDRRAPRQAEPLMRLINCIESCEDVNLSGIDRDLIVYALARTLSTSNQTASE